MRVFVTAFSCLTAGAFFWLAPFIMTNDTGGYLQNAIYLLTQSGSYIYWRTPGYSALLVMTGVAHGNSLYPLVIIQFLLGALIPVMVYFSLELMCRAMAAVASVIVTLSLIPFINASSIMTNEFFMFLVIAAMLCTARYIFTQNPLWLLGIAVTYLTAIMVRPQADWVYLILLFGCALAIPRYWAFAGLAAVLIFSLQLSLMVERRNLSHSLITDLSLTSAGGKYLLFPVLQARDYDSNALLLSSVGPATQKMYAALGQQQGEKFLTQDFWIAGQWAAWNELDRQLGRSEADQLCKDVFWEFSKAYPKALLKQFGFNILVSAFPQAAFPSHPDMPDYMPAMHRANLEVKASQTHMKLYETFANAWGSGLYINKSLLTVGWFGKLGCFTIILALLGAFIVRQRTVFAFWLSLIGVASYQILLCAFIATPYFAYNSVAFIFFIMAATITIQQATRRVQQNG